MNRDYHDPNDFTHDTATIVNQCATSPLQISGIWKSRFVNLFMTPEGWLMLSRPFGRWGRPHLQRITDEQASHLIRHIVGIAISTPWKPAFQITKVNGVNQQRLRLPQDGWEED